MVIFACIISILKTSGIINIFEFLFNPIFNYFKIPSSFITPLINGVLEITNGISAISNISYKKMTLNILFSSFILGLGGISIFLQVYSIVSKTDLSIKPYIFGKILQSFFSVIITYIFIRLFPFFVFDI